jgi:hypothetical protein
MPVKSIQQQMLYYIHCKPSTKAVDTGDAGAHIFFADFSKGFDLVDHTILLQEVENLQVILYF